MDGVKTWVVLTICIGTSCSLTVGKNMALSELTTSNRLVSCRAMEKWALKVYVVCR